jgi:urease accessory protein
MIQVGFAASGSDLGRPRTFVSRQRASHPYHLCRALYRPDDPPGMATLYVQGCSGGIFEGDRLALDFTAEPGSRVHLTTAAATIVHRMPGGDVAHQRVNLRVQAGALFEYWPDPLILFPGSRLQNQVRLQVAPSAQVIAVDAFLGHRLPDDDRAFDWLDSETLIEDLDGRLLARERFVARGSAWGAATAGLAGDPVSQLGCQGTLLVIGAGAGPLAALRQALAEDGGKRSYAGATLLPDGLGVMVRVLAADAVALKQVLRQVWGLARQALGVPAGRIRPK